MPPVHHAICDGVAGATVTLHEAKHAMSPRRPRLPTILSPDDGLKIFFYTPRGAQRQKAAASDYYVDARVTITSSAMPADSDHVAFDRR